MGTQELLHRLAGFDTVDFAGPASGESISDAERQLGVAFSPQYKEFLAKFGCGGIESEEIIGLGGPPHLDIVSMTVRLRSRSHALPEHLLPLRGDGFGNYDCINTAKPTADGEYEILFWRHDFENDPAPDLIASSFNEWLESVLAMIETDNTD